MGDKVSEASRQRLISELKLLRRGRGLSVLVLPQHPWLIEVIKPGTVEGIVQELTQLIESRMVSREDLALANALNLLPATRMNWNSFLEQRRAKMLKRPEFQSMYGSSRTLVRCEDAGFDELADAIIKNKMLNDDALKQTEYDLAKEVEEEQAQSRTPRAILTELLDDLSKLQRKVAKALVELEK